jgi:hypothetical protein
MAIIEHMFEDAGRPGTETVSEWVRALAELERTTDDAERVEQIRALEELKAAVAAAQARVTAALDTSVRARHAASGVPADRQGQGVAAQVALARRESPVRGGQHLGLAKALVYEMPHTLAALSRGVLSEWRATLLVRETACLTVENRAWVDVVLARDPARLEGMGDRALVAEARRLAYRLEPEASVARSSKAESERRVTLRPAPDTMAVLSGLLPVAQGVAAYAALVQAADSARAAGDSRSRGQIMADTLVERVTGQSFAPAVPVSVGLVMTDRALLAGDNEPAQLLGYGTVPAAWARALVSGTSATTAQCEEARVWIRRLFTHPASGELVATESRSRIFPAGLRAHLLTRDQTCRTPWCDAPVRHADHVVPHVDGGPTSAANGEGLCEACNFVKQAPDWHAGPAPGSRPGRHVVEIITPTGHHYWSRPPPMPGAPDVDVGGAKGGGRLSRLEARFAELLRGVPAA